jgi:hypothetical protein
MKSHPHAIGDLVEKQARAIVVFINNRVFRADVLFIRTENTVGARSAQWPYGARGPKGAEEEVVVTLFLPATH